MKTTLRCLATLLIFLTFFGCSQPQEEVKQPASYVNPFIGTGGHGHTFPGATVPFGMLQLSPQTRLDGWDGCSGYHATDSILYGFAHTALSGTGVSDYGDILLMPVVGKPVFDRNEYCSLFSKAEEKATAGYYSVKLQKPDVLAEMTATTRAGYHRYTFPQTDEAQIIIDLEHRDQVTDSWIEFVSDTEIRGMRRSTNWAKDMVWFFHMKFSKPFVRSGIVLNGSLTEGIKNGSGTRVKAFVGFTTAQNEAIEVKVGLSAVDSEGALRNLETEMPDWGFDKVKKDAEDQWNKELSVITIEGGSNEQKTIFYTALYHTMIQPNVFMDVDRRFRGMDRNIHTAENFTNYTVFSLWDTYRAWHPLMTIIGQQRTNDFIKTMLNMYQQTGLLPIWELAGNETYCMIGNHAVPVIADAWVKGIRDYNADEALQAMIESVNKHHFGFDVYRQVGFLAGDKEHEAVSKTLEYGYDDWCIATMAGQMGKNDVYEKYMKAAQAYKNIFDPSTGFMRPRVNGGWLSPFDPTTVDWNFTEANSWQYSFYVPHDIAGFIRLHGVKEALSKKIDELFEATSEVGGRDMKDITGLIGQYAHGNEPSHHMAYLYNYLNQPWKTQEKVRYIMDHFYTNMPDGLIGNEDCGQMSAWLVMSALGFYPVSPGQADYAIGTPLYSKASIHLENGKTFTIKASKLGPDSKYIQSATLNGKTYNFNYLTHETIMAGGELHFEMGNQPNKSWGSADENIATTAITTPGIVPVPIITTPGKRIREAVEVSIQPLMENCQLYYSLDGSEPTTGSLHYTGPFMLDKTSTIKAIAYHNDLGFSKVSEANLVKINSDYSIHLSHPYQQNYSAGGDDALIDGILGNENWRLGGWQGYQGTDLEAVIDLGKSQQVSRVSIGLLQDIRSWIWMPSSVEFYSSTDGVHFQQKSIVKHQVPTDKEGIFIERLSGKINTNTRYIKVIARNFGTIPDWHLGAGGKAYIFADEIRIE
ncbi:GH92 family glycosyl hydrolase [Bacteroidales bacterium]